LVTVTNPVRAAEPMALGLTKTSTVDGFRADMETVGLTEMSARAVGTNVDMALIKNKDVNAMAQRRLRDPISAPAPFMFDLSCGCV
jgi:hypothetical protein